MAKWTDAQLLAIETDNKTVLVSAAAGSGKTTTLTERIIRRITDKEKCGDIGRFLVVTFTKAAAADLKNKISRALSEELAKNPANRHLSRQMIKLGSADICTIDAFYLSVVKHNFELLGLPARLNMIDEGELKVMKLRIIEEVIEDFYEKRGKDFASFMDCFMDYRGNTDASSALIKIYDTLSGYPEFLEFLTNNVERLREEAEMPFLMTRAGKEIKNGALKFFDHCERIYSDATMLIDRDEKAKKAYSPAFSYDKAHFSMTKDAIENDDYARAVEMFATYSMISLGALRNADPIFAAYRDMRKDCIAEYRKMGEELFSFREELLSEDAVRTADFCLTLYDLLTEFNRRFSEEKIGRSASDFTDNKRFAMKLFIGEDGKPTSLAKEYSEKYDEIYIDEYQDTDIVQDMIFSAISRPDNRFMVGDIKQSIYRFRGANPSVFATYKNSFPEASSDKGGHSCAIYMSENFRCDKTVIDTTNSICGYLFRGGPNSILYTEKDDLKCGKITQPPERTVKAAQLCVIRAYNAASLSKMSEEERESCRGDGKELECAYIAGEISRLLSDPDEKCEEGGALRRIEPRDIAILTRDNSSADRLAQAIRQRGIPCSARTTVNYFENPEVLLAMSLLNVIDNPHKDVHLAAVLRSPLFGFGMGELVRIRNMKSGGISLYDDVVFAKDNMGDGVLRDKISYFLQKLSIYRERARLLSVDRLLRFLYADTSLLSFACSGGDEDERATSERRANLLLLYDYARKYETGSYKGLYSFISYINDIISSGQTIASPALGDSANVVSVMTIHNSKGLEFPICFIASIQKNIKNSKRSIIEFDHDIGIGVLFGDESGFATMDNAIRRAIIGKNKREDLEEEMRVLYVAMTRARERLYLSGYVKNDDWQEKAEKNALYADEYSIMSAGSYFSWITTAYMAMGEEQRESLRTVCLEPKDISGVMRDTDITETPEKKLDGEKTDEIFSALKERFDFKYEYSHLSRLPAKLSVSGLYPFVLDESDSANASGGEITLREKPEFLIPRSERASGADRGTATHTFMQFCSFENAEANGVQNEIERLCGMGLMERSLAELINISHVEAFFGSDFYRDMKKAIAGGGRLFREQRFNIGLPAVEFTKDEALQEKLMEEKIVVQGVIDLVFIDRYGNLTLCDYKTDFLTVEELSSKELAAKKLTERHRTQLSYYSKAIEMIFDKAPSRICIYSLPFGEALDVNII